MARNIGHVMKRVNFGCDRRVTEWCKPRRRLHHELKTTSCTRLDLELFIIISFSFATGSSYKVQYKTLYYNTEHSHRESRLPVAFSLTFKANKFPTYNLELTPSIWITFQRFFFCMKIQLNWKIAYLKWSQVKLLICSMQNLFTLKISSLQLSHFNFEKQN